MRTERPPVSIPDFCPLIQSVNRATLTSVEEGVCRNSVRRLEQENFCHSSISLVVREGYPVKTRYGVR